MLMMMLIVGGGCGGGCGCHGRYHQWNGSRGVVGVMVVTMTTIIIMTRDGGGRWVRGG